MAYLGKISAVIAANTQDFTRNIGLAKKELGDFAKKVQGLQLNLNTNALDKTLTKTQRFQREIQAIEKLLAKGVDLGIDPKKLNDQFRAFEDIGKPLTKLKDQIEGLSLSLQAELYPELGKIQAGFRNLYNEIGNGSAEYDKSEKRIESLRLALVRLGRTTAAAADLGKLSQSLDANNAGASFFQPRAKQALQQSLALRGQAEQVPARFRSSAFADLAVSAEENANKIEQQAGRIARIQLEIARRGESRTRLFDLSEAEGQLDALTRRQESINLAFKRQLRGAQIAQVVSPEAQGSVDTLISRLSSLSTQLRAINGQQFEGLISGASRVVAQFNAGETSAKKAKQAVDALASALNSVNTGKTLADKTRSLLFTDSERQRQQIQSDFDRQRAAGDPAADVRRRANLTRLSLNEDIIPRNRQLEASAAETGDVELQRRAQRLSAISRQVSNEIQKAFNLSASGKVEAADQQLAKTNRLIEQQSARYRKLAADIEVANQARSQQNLFLEASGGRGEQLSQGARDAAADISTARQFRGQIASGASRIAIQGEIDRVTASVTSLQREMAKVAASDLKTDEKARKLDQLDNEIRQATKGLAAFVAAQSGGAYNTSQIEKAMQMARNTAGSLSARSSQVAQLAFQQALFAIDDLISSTGGLEYKLRAVGNNITQLGLLLGQSGIIPGLSATTGLFVGLATVIGGQAVSAMLRWATGSEAAEARTKSLNEALSRQKTLAEDLARAFESLGDSIARGAFSEPAKSAREFAKDLESISKKQAALRGQQAADLDPEVQRERAAQSKLKDRLESSSDPGERVALARQLRESSRRESAAAARAAAPPPSGAQVAGLVRDAVTNFRLAEIRGISNIRQQQGIVQRADREASRIPLGSDKDSLARQAAAIDAAIKELESAGGAGGGFLFGTEAERVAKQELAKLQAALTAIQEPLQKAIDELSNQILQSSRGVSTAIEDAQNDVADAIRRGVVGAADFQAALDSTARQLDEAQQRLRDAQAIADPAAREREVLRAEREIGDIRLRQDAINERAREVRLGRTLGGERTTSALSSLQGNERFANEYAGLTARLTEAVDAEMAARNELNQAIEGGNQSAQVEARAKLEAAQASGDLAAAAAEAAIAMEQAVSRLRKIADGALSESEKIADDAQRRFTEKPTAENRRGRDEAERQLIEDRRRVAQANNAIDDRRSRAMRSDQLIQQVNDELEQIRAERERLGEAARIGGQDVDPAAMRRLADREAQLMAAREQRLLALSEAERRQADAIAQEIDSRRRVIETLERQRQFEEAQNNRRRPQGDPMRGLDLLETDRQRVAREMRQGYADIDAAIQAREDAIMNQIAPDGLPARAPTAAERGELDGLGKERADARKRLQEDMMRQAAPTITGMVDSVANAVLQGPSRAALNASDVSTTQGAQELNRLLRGDDPNKNVDLVNLQREANRLLGVIADNKNPVAN